MVAPVKILSFHWYFWIERGSIPRKGSGCHVAKLPGCQSRVSFNQSICSIDNNEMNAKWSEAFCRQRRIKKEFLFFVEIVIEEQCDQIGRFIALWTIFQSLWQQLFCPNQPHFYAIFGKVSKPFIFLMKYFLGNFYRHLATFYWSLCLTDEN